MALEGHVNIRVWAGSGTPVCGTSAREFTVFWYAGVAEMGVAEGRHRVGWSW